MPGFAALKDETQRPGKNKPLLLFKVNTHFSYCVTFTEQGGPHQGHTAYLTNSTEQRSQTDIKKMYQANEKMVPLH